MKSSQIQPGSKTVNDLDQLMADVDQICGTADDSKKKDSGIEKEAKKQDQAEDFKDSLSLPSSRGYGDDYQQPEMVKKGEVSTNIGVKRLVSAKTTKGLLS